MQNYTIGVIGLGYVGLPLAIAFAERYRVVGFDIDAARITDLKKGNDHTREITKTEIDELTISFDDNGDTVSRGLYLTNDSAELKACNIYIITVPTPVSATNEPDLTLLKEATVSVAQNLDRNDIVIYESTVYPGCTEEIAVPILENNSGLLFNIDFFCGYSPERINPGDKKRKLADIRKITSGSTPSAAAAIDGLYRSIITAGTYPAPSIKVAEAAKVIENTQRDINIAFVNELAKIFHLLDIDTSEVLKAAGTKWNFLAFQPGLVGGHCIGVDPYYLAHRSMIAGYNPEIILAARKLNDSMGSYIAMRLLGLMAKKGIPIKNAEVLIMGIAFKENFPDVRNSRVMDIINELREYQMRITVYDPVVSGLIVKNEYGIELCDDLSTQKFDVVLAAVNHAVFKTIDITSMTKDQAVVFDVKGGLYDNGFIADGRL